MNKTILIWVLLAVFATLYITSLFPKKQVDEKMVEDRVKREILEKELPLIRQELKESDARYDSLLAASQQRITKLESKKQPLYNAIKQIPVIIDNYDKRQLADASAEYFRQYGH